MSGCLSGGSVACLADFGGVKDVQCRKQVQGKELTIGEWILCFQGMAGQPKEVHPRLQRYQYVLDLER